MQITALVDFLKEFFQSIDGVIGVAVFNSVNGELLGQEGSTINLDIATAGYNELIRAQVKTLKALGVTNSIKDILITLQQQYHILIPFPSNHAVYLYAALEQSANSNIALTRKHIWHQVVELDKKLTS